jgi:hypothetical protein
MVAIDRLVLGTLKSEELCVGRGFGLPGTGVFSPSLPLIFGCEDRDDRDLRSLLATLSMTYIGGVCDHQTQCRREGLKGSRSRATDKTR